MDHTPSLSRSPASPPNSYCPSEASSLEYPSPDLLAQQYRISSLYGADSFCSMAPTQDSEVPLFALDAVSQPGWDHTTTAHAPNTSVALPTILSTEYDPFGGFSSTVPAVYGHGMYPGTLQSHKPTSLAGTPSPVIAHSRSPTAPMSRSPLSFSIPPTSLPSSSSVSRGGGEAAVTNYARITGVSQFPSPRSIHVPYHIEPAGVYGAGGNASGSSGYISDGTAAVWGHPAPTTGQLYSTASTHQQQTSGMMPEQQSRGTRPRRQPRRLTTKEEANFQCEVKGCGKLFSRSYNYKAHMETHDEKREYPFPCQVPDCNKRFVRKTDLQRHHQSVHMKERNHKCDYCGRLFARKDTLRRHMDDGCSKRFDIGTLDLRTEGVSSTSSGPQDHVWRVR